MTARTVVTGAIAPRAPRAALVALLAALLPAAGAPFTPGNLLLLAAGDGTVAGSGWPSAYAAQDRNSTATVAAAIVEYALNESTGLFSPTGLSAPVPASSAGGGAGLSVLGLLADLGNSARSSNTGAAYVAAQAAGTFQPYSGLLSLSPDGVVASFVGYRTGPGTPVGVSTRGNDLATSLLYNDAASVTPPAASISRVIGWVDASGAVGIVDGDLDSVLGGTVATAAVWVSDGASGSGFYVSGGYTWTATLSFGGLFWVAMPFGIGGPMGDITQICLPPTMTSNSFKMYGSFTSFGDWLYVARSTPGQHGGVSIFPGYPTLPTSASALCSSSPNNLDNALGNSQNSPSQGGWAIHGAVFVTDNATGTTTMWTACGEQGLSLFTQCSGSPLACSGRTAAAGAYQTRLPPEATQGLANAQGLISIASVAIGGVAHVAVNRVDGLWLWPTTNTGPYAGATGSCCTTTSAGACCWANGNSPVLLPPTSRHFRGSVPVPAAPTCATPGYACADGVTPPAVACAAGYYCPGGGSPALPCAAGTYSGAYFSACVACAAGLYSVAGSAACSGCTQGVPSSCTYPPGMSASASVGPSVNPCFEYAQLVGVATGVQAALADPRVFNFSAPTPSAFCYKHVHQAVPDPTNLRDTLSLPHP